MRGRTGRRWLAACALALLLAGAAFALHRALHRPSRANIVLIVWDTCRADRTQVNGYALPTTPNLLRFAAEGAVFRQCWTPSPWTPPAHASLFTGLLPRNHGLREDAGDRVKPGIPLLAETLRDAGYETACVVANPQISDLTGLDEGFDRRIRCFDSKVPGAKGMDVGERVLGWLGERAAAGRGKPFFLFVNLMESHAPYAIEDDALAAVRGPAAVAGAREAAATLGDDAVLAHVTGIRRVDPALFPAINAAYDGAVRLVDRSTGRLLDRSVVVIVGDHGENLGEHGALGHVHSLSAQALHVPLVVRWPGRFPPGRVEDAQVRLQDLYPTLLEAARVAVPAACGRDAAALTEAPLRSRTAVAEFGPSPSRIPGLAKISPHAPPHAVEHLFRALLAVRDPVDRPGARNFHSVNRTTIGGPPEVLREELYDPVADPGEERDLLSGPPSPAEKAAADRLRALGGR